MNELSLDQVKEVSGGLYPTIGFDIVVGAIILGYSLYNDYQAAKQAGGW